MESERDTLRGTEHAMHAFADSLFMHAEEFTPLLSPASKIALRNCLDHIKQLYSWTRYRALARMDETTAIDPVSGLPQSVEIGNVHHDTKKRNLNGAELTKEKAFIIRYILEKGDVPHAFVEKALRTAYTTHASNFALSPTLSIEPEGTKGSYWCSWSQHKANGQFAMYLMRFIVKDSTVDISAVLGQLETESKRISLASPGVFGAKIDEMIEEISPQMVCAWYVDSLALGDALSHTQGMGLNKGEYFVKATYEKAVSTGEREVEQGFFRSNVKRQIWEVGKNERTYQERLISERRELFFAPHCVLQRLDKKMPRRSLSVFVTDISPQEKEMTP